MAIDQSSGINRRALAIVVALFVAVASIVGLFILVQSQNKSGSGGGGNVGVWVTKTQLVAGATVGPNDVAVKQRDAGQLPSNYLDSTKTPVGQTILIAAAPETVLTQSTVAAAAIAPLAIPDNWVAMTIPNSSQLSVDGYVQAGDHIDVIVDANGGAGADIPAVRYGFQDVTVLKVTDAGAAAGGSLMVIAVPRAEAEELAYVEALPKPPVLTYVLRNKDQSSKIDPHTGLPQPPIYLTTGPHNTGSQQPAQLLLQVNGEGTDATSALNDATQRQKKLHDALVKVGVAETSMTLSPITLNNFTASSTLGPVTATANIVISVADPNTLREASDIARAAGIAQSYTPGSPVDTTLTSQQMNCLFPTSGSAPAT